MSKSQNHSEQREREGEALLALPVEGATRAPMKTVAIHTMGCKANQADSTYLEGAFREKGYQVVGMNDAADYYIFNTCTVTDQADREARQLTRRARRRNPAAKIVVTGCYAQTQPEVLAALDSVDEVVGNTHKALIPDELPSLPSHVEEERAIFKQNDVTSVGHSHYSKNTRAQVKIQDGCNKFCTFCIIPYARGKNRSVPIDDVLAELHLLKKHGFQEAVLTGIHIGTYGHDRNNSLEDLLAAIEHEKPLPRIRLSSLDPEEVSKELIERVAASDVICPHFHIAVQSGDNDILDRMKRRYRVDRFYQVIDMITSCMPEASIGTDVIVGFPGESEEQFERTYRMLEELPISYIHVFPYSSRRNTPAAAFDDQLDNGIKKERSRTLNRLAREKKAAYYNRFIGSTQEVIVESRRDPKEGLLRGMTANYIPVLLDGDDSYIRQLIPVQLRHTDSLRVYGARL